MKNYIVEKRMATKRTGYCVVVVEGETHLNKTEIKSDIQFFTTEAGYDYNHPYQVALQNAQAIAHGLNVLEREKQTQKRRIVDFAKYPVKSL